MIAVGAAVAVAVGLLSLTSAAGLAIIGIVIGTGTSRGRFSSAPDGIEKN